MPDRRRGASDLTARVATAAVGIPLVLLVNARGGWLFALLIGLAALIAEIEMVRLLRSGPYRPAILLAVPAAVLLSVVPFLPGHAQDTWVAVSVALLILGGLYYLLPVTYPDALANWLATVGAGLYVGLLLGHLALLREVHRGAWWVLLILLLTWAFDTGAYFAGSRFGRHPFMAHISPRKTVEGVGGGIILAALVGLLGIPLVGLRPWQGLLLGALLGVVAQVGDLVESMIKRKTGVKDSGAIIPGHGGLLDRIDSLLFTGVAGFYAAAAFGYVS
ncbi:MAG: phosphatidate cytidylyltransferase [Chloroflexota bacterium]